jgi:hypothetical protein
VLPDGIFSNQKFQFGLILEGLAMEDVGICMTILSILRSTYILWPFGTFCDNLVHFVIIWYIFPVLVCCTEKNLATLLEGLLAHILQIAVLFAFLDYLGPCLPAV